MSTIRSSWIYDTSSDSIAFIAKSASASPLGFASKVMALGFLGFPGSRTFIFTRLFERTSAPPPLFYRRQPLKIILSIPSSRFYSSLMHYILILVFFLFLLLARACFFRPHSHCSSGWLRPSVYLFHCHGPLFSYRRHARSFHFSIHPSTSTHRSRRLINTDSMLFSSPILFRPIVPITASYRLHISDIVTYCHHKHALCPSTLKIYLTVIQLRFEHDCGRGRYSEA